MYIVHSLWYTYTYADTYSTDITLVTGRTSQEPFMQV